MNGLYTQDIGHCFGPAMDRAQFEALLPPLAAPLAALAKHENARATPLVDIVGQTADLADIEALAAQIRHRFTDVVVAGTGGSGLSGRTLTELKPLASPAFHFLENLDPDVMEAVLARLDPKRTFFLVISKSGGTVETLSQYYVLLEHVTRTLGEAKAREHFAVITMQGDNPLRQSAQERGLRLLEHAPDIGGRFCIFTNVGLLPAAIAGLDIRALRRGAHSVVAQLEQAAGLADFLPAVGAALQVAFMRHGYPISVMLPYASRLGAFSSWYRQSWAESLGKQGKGSTPIRAVGTTDQHSQMQLYLDGPKDKSFHMILLNRAGSGPAIPAPSRQDLHYLQGKTMGDVMAAEQKATFETLVARGCPVRLFALETLNEASMGALLMHFMLEIILTASLLEVNPFDQPAVEQGKVLAREYLLSNHL